MRNFSHTAKSDSVFTVEGTCSFPGEISSRLCKLLEIAHDCYYDLIFDAVFCNKRSAREKLQGLTTPAEFRSLNGLRLWLNRLDRQDHSAVGTVHSILNLNTGECLVFVNDNDFDDCMSKRHHPELIAKAQKAQSMKWLMLSYDFKLPKQDGDPS